MTLLADGWSPPDQLLPGSPPGLPSGYSPDSVGSVALPAGDGEEEGNPGGLSAIVSPGSLAPGQAMAGFCMSNGVAHLTQILESDSFSARQMGHSTVMVDQYEIGYTSGTNA